MILLGAVGFSFMACKKKNNDEPSNDQFFLDCNLSVSYKNAQGDDLLNSNTSGAYKFDQMKLYYKINDSAKEVYYPNMDAPRNILLIKDLTPYQLRIFTDDPGPAITDPNETKTGTSITYLKLDSLDTDTIEADWERKSTYFVNLKIRYNGVEKPRDVPFVILK